MSSDAIRKIAEMQKKLEADYEKAGERKSSYTKYAVSATDMIVKLKQNVAVIDMLKAVVSNTDWDHFDSDLAIRRRKAQNLVAEAYKTQFSLSNLHVGDPDAVLLDTALKAGLTEQQAVKLVVDVETADSVPEVLKRFKELDEDKAIASKRPNADNGMYDQGLLFLKLCIMQANAEGRSHIGRFAYLADQLEELCKVMTGTKYVKETVDKEKGAGEQLDTIDEEDDIPDSVLDAPLGV